MKCLSLKQPYAEFLASGKKKIELRTWNTRFRGRFLIHASMTIDKYACKYFRIDPETLDKGAVVGAADLVGVKQYIDNTEFKKELKKHLAVKGYSIPIYGFIINNPIRFKEPRRMRGMLGFFEV